MLSDYGNHMQDLRAIFSEAQNNEGMANPFDFDKKARSYVERIKATTYYREIYGANWTIPYLNGAIDKAFEALRAFDPKKSRELHLLELLD